MNWWGSVLWSKQAVYTAFSITAADKPVLSGQFCQKSLINFFPKGHFLKANYWVSFSSNTCILERKLKFKMSPKWPEMQKAGVSAVLDYGSMEP